MKKYNEIKSLTEYNNRMAKSLLDKVFFLDKIDSEIIVDFGCANGELLKFISYIAPEKILIGYDIDGSMLKLAENNLKDSKNTKAFFSNWGKLEKYLGKYNKNSCLVLSSVLHEIYHYSSPKEIDEFWSGINRLNFKNIVIRDMIVSKTIERESNINDIVAIYQKEELKEALIDFEKYFSTINNNKNLMHFLLKYKYKKPNWAREVKENYFPLFYEELITLFPKDYEIIYKHQYILPYLYRQISTDFGIKIRDNTHLKIILEK